MKRNLLLQLLMILASLTAMGQGNVGRYEVKVGDFKTLRVVNDINVEYVCSADSAGLAVFSVRTFRRLPWPPARSMAMQRFF